MEIGYEQEEISSSEPQTSPREPASILVDVENEVQSTYRRQNDPLLLVLCCLATLTCFPIGVYSLYNLNKAKKQYKAGNITKARTYGLYTRYLSLIAILFGMVWIGVVIGLVV